MIAAKLSSLLLILISYLALCDCINDSNEIVEVTSAELEEPVEAMKVPKSRKYLPTVHHDPHVRRLSPSAQFSQPHEPYYAPPARLLQPPSPPRYLPLQMIPEDPDYPEVLESAEAVIEEKNQPPVDYVNFTSFKRAPHIGGIKPTIVISPGKDGHDNIVANCHQRSFASNAEEFQYLMCCGDRAYNTLLLRCADGIIINRFPTSTEAPKLVAIVRKPEASEEDNIQELKDKFIDLILGRIMSELEQPVTTSTATTTTTSTQPPPAINMVDHPSPDLLPMIAPDFYGRRLSDLLTFKVEERKDPKVPDNPETPLQISSALYFSPPQAPEILPVEIKDTVQTVLCHMQGWEINKDLSFYACCGNALIERLFSQETCPYMVLPPVPVSTDSSESEETEKSEREIPENWQEYYDRNQESGIEPYHELEKRDHRFKSAVKYPRKINHQQ